MILTERNLLNSYSLVAGEPIQNNSIAFVKNKKVFQSCDISDLYVECFPVYVCNVNIPGEPYDKILEKGKFLRCIIVQLYF